MTIEQERAMALARARARADQSYTGQILPFSKDAEGNIQFDSNAGLLGAVKDAFTLPGDAYAGRVDPLSQEGINRAANFALTVTPANPGVVAGDRVIPGVTRAIQEVIPEAPTAQALKEAGSAGYNQMRQMGVDYSAPSVKALSDALQARMVEQGFDPDVAPNTFSTLGKLSTPPEGSFATISNLEAARRKFGNIGQNFNNPTDRAASKIAREEIDQFILNPPEGSVLAGPAEEAAAVLSEARANTAAYKRAATIDKLVENKERDAAVANSGQNIGNSLRQGARDILKSDKARSGFSTDELAMLEEVARGTPGANATRFVGNLLGGGGGLGTIVTGAAGALGAGAASGNPTIGALGALVPLLGMASKKVSNAITRGGLEAVDEATRMRSPLYRALQEKAGTEVISPEQRALLVRALLASGGNSGGGGGF